MTQAYLKDHQAYYRGENITYSLQREVANASGREADLKLLSNLLSNAATVTKDNHTVPFMDQIPACSCLFILPLRIQAVLSILLSTWESWNLKNLAPKYPGYKINDYIMSPAEILTMNAAVLNTPVSPTVNSFLSIRKDYEDPQIVEALFGFSLDILKPTYYIDRTIKSEFKAAQIAQQVFDFYGYSNTFSTDLVSIINTGNRLMSLYYICAALGYSPATTKGLVGILELWEMTNN